MHPVVVFVSFSAVTLTIPHTAPVSESEPGPTLTVDPYVGMAFHSLRPSQTPAEVVCPVSLEVCKCPLSGSQQCCQVACRVPLRRTSKDGRLLSASA